MDNVSQFIEQLLKDKNLPALDEAVHAQLVKDLSDRLAQLINQRLIESLSDEAVGELEKMITEVPTDEVKIQSFMAEQLPNTSEITLNAMTEFRRLYLGTPA